jgi:hypothetical protein
LTHDDVQSHPRGVVGPRAASARRSRRRRGDPRAAGLAARRRGGDLELAWSLVLYEREDDGCTCQSGDLGLWTDGQADYEVCDFLGCCFEAKGRKVDPPPGLRPATRAEVLRRYPRAALVAP